MFYVILLFTETKNVLKFECGQMKDSLFGPLSAPTGNTF